MEAPPGLGLTRRLVSSAAALGLIVLFSPLLVAAAVAIRLSSRGPVLFRQERIGLHRALFATRSTKGARSAAYRVLVLFEWLTLRTASAVFATNESFRDNALRRGVPPGR